MSSRRSYRSTLREERARETRQRIRQSARRLFAERGFAETTIDQVADDAGVSPQTVYAVFGSKGGIVREMLEDLEESVDHDSWLARIRAEEDPRQQLRIFLSMIRVMFESGSPILRAVIVARSDPEVSSIAERGNRNRRQGTTQLTQMWSRRGALRRGLRAKEAAELLWLLTSAEQYLLATDELGWSPARYERWLRNLLETQLLQPDIP